MRLVPLQLTDHHDNTDTEQHESNGDNDMNEECPECGVLPDHNGECGCPCDSCGSEAACFPDCDCIWCEDY